MGEIAWVDKFPKCDICGKVARYDARMKSGRWGYLCDDHFKKHGVGLGTGKGQELKLRLTECVMSEAGGKPSGEALVQAVKKCTPPIKSVTMTMNDFERAVFDGLWYPICPYCGNETGAEPDADAVYCNACTKKFKIINPYF